MDIINYSIKDFMDHNPDCAACEYKNICAGGWMNRKNGLFRRLGLITGDDDKAQVDSAPVKGV